MPEVRFRETPLRYEPTPVFLGVKFDDQLTFSDHVEDVKKKMAARSRCISALAGRTYGSNREVLKAAYLAYVRSVFDYGAAIYCTTTAPTNRARLEVE